MVPGSTEVITPSNSIAFSEFIMVRLSEPALKLCDRRLRAIKSDLPAIAHERALCAVCTRPLFAGTRFTYIQGAAIQFLAIGRGNRGIGFARVIHGDESKPARPAGHTIGHERDFADFAVLFEKILKIVL